MDFLKILHLACFVDCVVHTGNGESGGNDEQVVRYSKHLQNRWHLFSRYLVAAQGMDGAPRSIDGMPSTCHGKKDLNRHE